jgi:uncharacterized protein VirK/YbjX
MPRKPASLTTTGLRVPGPWEGVGWALRGGADAGDRAMLGARATVAALRHGKTLRRWMGTLHDLRTRGLIDEVPQEFLRALYPPVSRGVSLSSRIAQLVDHLDWLETAVLPEALQRLGRGESLVLLELTPPRGYDAMRLQLRRAPLHSPEGELLLALTLRRAAAVQPGAQDVDVAVLAFTRMRMQGAGCLAIGGVRGQREATHRVSPVELQAALHGWKTPVFMVRVAQELARHWSLHLVALDPTWHRLRDWPWRWSRTHREAALKIGASHAPLWEHFGATPGPQGWLVLPLDADEKLGATALSPEKRARQVRRADFWLRTRNQLRAELGRQLVRLAPESRLDGATQQMDPRSVAPATEWAPGVAGHSA